MEGRLPETVLKGGAGSGVLRPRLVTAGSGGPGHRPPGMTTWLRGARCTDPEAMPEMEARPPAENRHGGAPRGERPASWDAPRLTRADPSRLANATTEIVRLSALRPPLQGDGRERKASPGMTTGAGRACWALQLRPRTQSGQGTCSNNKPERDDDSKRSHHALGGLPGTSSKINRAPAHGHRSAADHLTIMIGGRL
jgi:hypothetical protein